MKESLFKRIIFEKRYRLLRHVLFWVVIDLVYPTMDLGNHVSFVESYTIALVLTPQSIIYAYGVIYWLVPRYLITEKYGRFLLFFVIWVFVGLLLNALSHYLFYSGPDGRSWRTTMSPADFIRGSFNLVSFIVNNSIAMFALFIKMFKYWYIKQRQTLQLATEKLAAELQLLKAQLHPHFLFNTLNSLYALVLEKSDKAPEMLMKLSGLLSYMLYNCNATAVSLEKEVEIMEHYISLEQERYGERLEISVSIDGDLSGKEIAPLLLLPFLENSFKHGAAEQLGKAWISLDLSLLGQGLQLNLVNGRRARAAASSAHYEPETGIGIENVRRRLDLLYPGRFSLKMGAEEELFYVALTLQL
jgi:sensor histidine kinase YesM